MPDEDRAGFRRDLVNVALPGRNRGRVNIQRIMQMIVSHAGSQLQRFPWLYCFVRIDAVSFQLGLRIRSGD